MIDSFSTCFIVLESGALFTRILVVDVLSKYVRSPKKLSELLIEIYLY